MTFVSFLLLLNIGLAGALGAVARYLFSRLIIEHVPTIFPLLQYPKKWQYPLQYAKTKRRKKENLRPLPMSPDMSNSTRMRPNTSSGFPLGTLLINVLGAFLIGLVFALTSHALLTPTLQLILATGFLGGFTTFSTMTWEGFQLARGGKVSMSFLYFAGSFALGLLAEMLGMLLGGWS